MKRLTEEAIEQLDEGLADIEAELTSCLDQRQVGLRRALRRATELRTLVDQAIDEAEGGQ